MGLDDPAIGMGADRAPGAVRPDGVRRAVEADRLDGSVSPGPGDGAVLVGLLGGWQPLLDVALGVDGQRSAVVAPGERGAVGVRLGGATGRVVAGGRRPLPGRDAPIGTGVRAGPVVAACARAAVAEAPAPARDRAG